LRARIQKNMALCILLTLIIAYGVTTFAVYRQTTSLVWNEIHLEADYVCAAVEISGEDYLQEIDIDPERTRITLIDSNGDVLYDTKSSDSVTFENHSGRPEFQQALKNGSGSAVRKSDSLDEQMFYYAKLLSDGKVIRVSKTTATVWVLALNFLPAMLITAVVLLISAWAICKRQAERLVRPINEIDIEHPLDNEIYEELKLLLERIDQQNKAKDAIADMRKEFSANVSHELKTPLTSISGYAEILKAGMVPEEDVPGISTYIYDEAQRLVHLIEDIMRLSKLDEGHLEGEMSDVDLYEMAIDIGRRLDERAHAAKVKLTITGEHVKVNGVRHVLDEMIYNIVENAVKYNRENGIVKIWVGGTPLGPKVIVTDTGIGIPEESQERIFERFYRVDKSHSKENGGTGLGLSIVKHGAALHNAKINVESTLGEGTRMEVLFTK
jgi:two-component system, OmpR family, phosphate regulon sensor histidine kinase PhoR